MANNAIQNRIDYIKNQTKAFSILSVLLFSKNKDQTIYCKALHNILPRKTDQLIVLFSSKLDPHNNHFLTQISTSYCETELLSKNRTSTIVAFASLQLLDNYDTTQIPRVKQCAEEMVLHKQYNCTKYEELSGFRLLRK